ncbi:MAG TPA: aldose 1-epimerase family protein [Bacteroidia bacterium]|nr:aldose 1-epimerase family protein [Bacteroidia bacterium]
MITTLSSNDLEVLISSRGAELQSVMHRSGHQYLWQGDPEIWPRRAPVLFPIVGKLKDQEYVFKRHKFKLPQHGFARDMVFEDTSKHPNEAVYTLKSSKQSLENYPFDFELVLTYHLELNTLKCSYLVRNTGGSDMLFSIGAHPGFRIDSSRENKVCLAMEKAHYTVSRLDSGLLEGQKDELNIPDKNLRLVPSVFEQDALVFENAQVGHIKLVTGYQDRHIEMICENWPFFGIWSKSHPAEKSLRFVCLEPWYGIADTKNHNKALEQKKGILQLSPGAAFTSDYRLIFH